MFLLNSTTRTRPTAEPLRSRPMAPAAALLALLTACSLDATPRVGRSDGQASPAWTPPPAAGSTRPDAGRRDDEPAGASSISGRPGPIDAGEKAADGGRRPGRDAGTRPTAPSTGTPMSSSDASIVRDASATAAPNPPTAPAARDASTLPPPSSDAAAAPSPTTPTPDAATAPTTVDASTPPPPTTTPDAGAPQPASVCKPGRYSGAFRGSVRANNDAVANISGAIRAQLELDAASNSLLLRNARVTGDVQDQIMLRATLAGRIDCTSLRLEDGSLEDGRVSLGGARNNFSFSGTLEGEYTPEPAAVSGRWTGRSDDIGQVTAEGTWSLRLNE